MIIWTLAGESFPDSAFHSAVLGSAIMGRGRPLIETFNAAGVLLHDYGIKPLIVADSSRVPIEAGTITTLESIASSEAFHELVDALGGSPAWLWSVALWALPAPQPLALQVQQADLGTEGFQVTWSGKQGFLTAGHVAKMNAGPVTDTGGSLLGNVRFSSDPAGQGKAPAADVALVEYAPGKAPAPSGISKASHLGPDDSVIVQSSGGAIVDKVRAGVTFYYSNATNGTWAEVYQTQQGLTQGGDSGSVVVDANGRGIGTVVAGNPGYTTLVQTVDYQLTQINRPGLSLS